MSFQTLTYQKKDNVLTICIVGPANDWFKMIRMSDELAQLCDEIALDEEIRVVILTGAEENSFSMGTDAIKKILGGEEGESRNLRRMAEPIAKLSHPIIAAINGDAIGQGLELALACDIRIAAETSHFGLPHIKVGLIPWDGGTQRLSRLVGSSKALEMILSGEVINAQEAFRIRLVNKIVPPGALIAFTMERAREMASKGPIALKFAKEAIHKGMDLTLEQGLRLEADLYLLLHTTGDRTEGIKAFQGKKTPRFEGR